MPTISIANPPKARKKLVKTKVHNTELSDQYSWIRDDNWQEVLHSPNVLKKNIRKYSNKKVKIVENSHFILENKISCIFGAIFLQF